MTQANEILIVYMPVLPTHRAAAARPRPLGHGSGDPRRRGPRQLQTRLPLRPAGRSIWPTVARQVGGD